METEFNFISSLIFFILFRYVCGSTSPPYCIIVYLQGEFTISLIMLLLKTLYKYNNISLTLILVHILLLCILLYDIAQQNEQKHPDVFILYNLESKSCEIIVGINTGILSKCKSQYQHLIFVI